MTDDVATLRSQARSLARDIKGIQQNMDRMIDPDSAFNLNAEPIDGKTWDEWHQAYSNRTRLEADFVAVVRRLRDLEG